MKYAFLGKLLCAGALHVISHERPIRIKADRGDGWHGAIVRFVGLLVDPRPPFVSRPSKMALAMQRKDEKRIDQIRDDLMQRRTV